MRRMISVGTIVMLTFGMKGLVAQARPNFSGNWTNADPNAAASAEGITFLGFAFTAEQDDRTLIVTPTIHQVHRDERPEQLRAVFNLDGSESKNPLDMHASHGMTVNRISRVTWDGGRLVIATTTTSNGSPGWTQSQTWSLDASGNLIVEAVLTVRGETKTSKATYRKA
jgi:hypothetical protein